LPLINLKDLNKIISLCNKFLHTDISSNEHEEISATDLAKMQMRIDDMLLNGDFA
jgi:hypothetical protein